MNESHPQLETVNTRVQDGAMTIELNRPEALNAWNAQFGADLLACVDGLKLRVRLVHGSPL